MTEETMQVAKTDKSTTNKKVELMLAEAVQTTSAELMEEYSTAT